MACPHMGGPHWFTVYGAVGLKAPTCQRCGALRPLPLTPDEFRDYREATPRTRLIADSLAKLVPEYRGLT